VAAATGLTDLRLEHHQTQPAALQTLAAAVAALLITRITVYRATSVVAVVRVLSFLRTLAHRRLWVESSLHLVAIRFTSSMRLAFSIQNFKRLV
jgi:hypothetical protein